MINTLNETHLHKALKALYQLQNPGSTTETPVGSFIADIVVPGGTAGGDVIEIQTGSLAHLRGKVDAFLAQGRRVTVVFPLATVKYIETYAADGTLRSRRKSPQKKPLHSMFRELTRLCPVLLHERFSLHVLETAVTELRTQTEAPVQSANGRRRYRKDWLKTGKRLEEILSTTTFCSTADYRALLPPGLAGVFSAREVHARLAAQGVRVTPDQVRLMLWVFVHMGLAAPAGTKSRARLYRLEPGNADRIQ